MNTKRRKEKPQPQDETQQHPKGPGTHHGTDGKKGSDGARGKQSLDLFAPDVLGDDLLGAVREVEVDEIGEQSHGDNDESSSSCLTRQSSRARTGRVGCECDRSPAWLPSINRGGAVKGVGTRESPGGVGVVWPWRVRVWAVWAWEVRSADQSTRILNYGSGRLRGTVVLDCKRSSCMHALSLVIVKFGCAHFLPDCSSNKHVK